MLPSNPFHFPGKSDKYLCRGWSSFLRLAPVPKGQQAGSRFQRGLVCKQRHHAAHMMVNCTTTCFRNRSGGTSLLASMLDLRQEPVKAGPAKTLSPVGREFI